MPASCVRGVSPIFGGRFKPNTERQTTYLRVEHAQVITMHCAALRYFSNTRALTRAEPRIFLQSVRGHRGRQNSRHIADYSATIDAGTTGGHHLGGPGPPGPAPRPPGGALLRARRTFHRAVPQRTRARSQTRLTPPCCRRRRRRGRRTRHAHAPDSHAAGRALSGRSGAHAAP